MVSLEFLLYWSLLNFLFIVSVNNVHAVHGKLMNALVEREKAPLSIHLSLIWSETEGILLHRERIWFPTIKWQSLWIKAVLQRPEGKRVAWTHSGSRSIDSHPSLYPNCLRVHNSSFTAYHKVFTRTIWEVITGWVCNLFVAPPSWKTNEVSRAVILRNASCSFKDKRTLING